MPDLLNLTTTIVLPLADHYLAPIGTQRESATRRGPGLEEGPPAGLRAICLHRPVFREKGPPAFPFFLVSIRPGVNSSFHPTTVIVLSTIPQSSISIPSSVVIVTTYTRSLPRFCHFSESSARRDFVFKVKPNTLPPFSLRQSPKLHRGANPVATSLDSFRR